MNVRSFAKFVLCGSLLALGGYPFGESNAETNVATEGTWKGSVDKDGVWIKISFVVAKGSQITGMRIDMGCSGKDESLMTLAPQGAKMPISREGKFEYSGEVGTISGSFPDATHASGHWSNSFGAQFECVEGKSSSPPSDWSAQPAK